tara:strand:- start:3353 stop:4294 length:942 start_codon:yes stop_codon:yes gene_type:complete
MFSYKKYYYLLPIIIYCIIFFLLLLLINKNISNCNRNFNIKEFFSKKVKRIQFKDFWGDLNPKNNFFTELLTRYMHKFEIVDNNPDIIIFSVFGNYQNINKNIKSIFFTGENHRVKKNVNLNLTFDNTSRYNNIRLPLWILYGYDENMILSKKHTNKFCCFVYSNNVDFRNNFCKKLSEYKQVDCGGNCLNNIGRKVENKLEFQKNYKFCIAYENSIQPGYTTEKILEAYKSNCIPIYCGSNTISDDFNPETFINAPDFKNENDLINYIKKVDTDEKLYETYFNKPIYSKKWLDIFNDPEEIFFKNIAEKIIS